MDGPAFFSRLKDRLAHARPSGPPTPGLKLRQAAVLAPLFWREGEPWVLLTQRPLHLAQHPGQISFPGGGRDGGDQTPLHTALRETQEELGIPPSQVEVLGLLSPMPTVSAYWVQPFVGVVPAELALTPQPGEVARVLEAPLLRLRPERRELLALERPVYVWGDGEAVVWGATWRMLRELVTLAADPAP
jgi:8-oxo-dGTP pyrophosphatase MutT (NUDIX family)